MAIRALSHVIWCLGALHMHTIHTSWTTGQKNNPVPIYIAAEGPKTLELAGEIADGVICGMGLTPNGWMFCQGGRGWIIAAPPLSSLFVASLRRERPSLPIRRLGFCLRFMSVACLLHQA